MTRRETRGKANVSYINALSINRKTGERPGKADIRTLTPSILVRIQVPQPYKLLIALLNPNWCHKLLGLRQYGVTKRRPLQCRVPTLMRRFKFEAAARLMLRIWCPLSCGR